MLYIIAQQIFEKPATAEMFTWKCLLCEIFTGNLPLVYSQNLQKKWCASLFSVKFE